MNPAYNGACAAALAGVAGGGIGNPAGGEGAEEPQAGLPAPPREGGGAPPPHDAGEKEKKAGEAAGAPYFDKAFEWLNLAAELGYADAKHAASDTDLSSLHTDPRWEQVMAKVKANESKANEAKANQEKASEEKANQPAPSQPRQKQE